LRRISQETPARLPRRRTKRPPVEKKPCSFSTALTITSEGKGPREYAPCFAAASKTAQIKGILSEFLIRQ
jgi:hypothetical protein